MHLTGSIAVQRFRRHRRQLSYAGETYAPYHEWLTIYENDDTRASVDGHLRYGATERMPISDGAEYDTVSDYYFDPVLPLPEYCAGVGFRLSDTILCGRVAVEGEHVESFERWFVEEHAELMSRSQATSTATLFRLSMAQMMKTVPFNNYVSIYSVVDPVAALHHWASFIRGRSLHASLGYDSAFAWGPDAEATIGCYAPVTPRITSESVIHAPPGERAVAEQVRAAQAKYMLTAKPMGL
jgi:hypothetical protein